LIVVAGVSHQTAPVAIREALAVPRERLAEALALARAQAGLEEAVLLSTCNRVELYGHGPDADPEVVLAWLAALHGRSLDELHKHGFALAGGEAIRHAFRVAASLESMVLGEPQILGQVKDAYLAAEQAGSLGPTLSALRNRTLAAAKRVRSETGIGQMAVSISHVAVELARKIFGELRGKHVLLVGAGKMSQLAARRLVDAGAQATVVGGRTFERAEELAASLGGRAVPFEQLRDEMALADIVISGTGAPGIVVQVADVTHARSLRRNRPLFLIDIAVPRDVDPAVRKLDGVFLYDLDDLHAVAQSNLRERQKEAAAATAIVEREVKEYLEWRKSLEVVPLLVDLRKRADEIRKAEIEKARRRLGTLTPEQEAALEQVTSAIVAKLLHPPTVQLKEIAKTGQPPEQVGFIRKLLGL
jgi:glutamyl-tRNA reductase